MHTRIKRKRERETKRWRRRLVAEMEKSEEEEREKWVIKVLRESSAYSWERERSVFYSPRFTRCKLVIAKERKTKENRKQSASICVAPRFRCFSFVLCVLSCVRSFFCGCEIVAKVVQTLKLSLLCGRVLFARFLSLFFAFYYLFFSRFLISLFRIAVSSSVPSIFA